LPGGRTYFAWGRTYFDWGRTYFAWGRTYFDWGRTYFAWGRTHFAWAEHILPRGEKRGEIGKEDLEVYMEGLNGRFKWKGEMEGRNGREKIMLENKKAPSLKTNTKYY
jgi:hypothetical protein